MKTRTIRPTAARDKEYQPSRPGLGSLAVVIGLVAGAIAVSYGKQIAIQVAGVF